MGAQSVRKDCPKNPKMKMRSAAEGPACRRCCCCGCREGFTALTLRENKQEPFKPFNYSVGKALSLARQIVTAAGTHDRPRQRKEDGTTAVRPTGLGLAVQCSAPVPVPCAHSPSFLFIIVVVSLRLRDVLKRKDSVPNQMLEVYRFTVVCLASLSETWRHIKDVDTMMKNKIM